MPEHASFTDSAFASFGLGVRVNTKAKRAHVRHVVREGPPLLYSAMSLSLSSSLFADGWHIYARWFMGYLPPVSFDDVHGWFDWIDDVQALLRAWCVRAGMGLCLARRTVLRAFIRGFSAHLMALEDAWVRMEMREYHDEPPNDSDW